MIIIWSSNIYSWKTQIYKHIYINLHNTFVYKQTGKFTEQMQTSPPTNGLFCKGAQKTARSQTVACL